MLSTIQAICKVLIRVIDTLRYAYGLATSPLVVELVTVLNKEKKKNP